jgi:serine/threonine protein kinase
MGDNDGLNRMQKDSWEGSDNSSSSFQKSQMSYMSPQGATMSTSLPDESLLRVLKSVVGSPFYVAPEVLQARGYDGPKADVWSLGVILYAMLAGNLPFEQELSSCKRFRLFCKWVREQTAKGIRFWNDHTVEYPQWLFPAKFSMLAKGLIVAMLHPDPEIRVSVSEAMRHPLCAAPFLGQTPAPNSAISVPSTVTPTTFSHLPVALAATTVSTSNTAVIHAQAHSLPNQMYDAIDATVMPIASVVTAATAIVAGGVEDIIKNHQSNEQENYSSLMEIDNQSQLDSEAEEMSLPGGRAGSPSRDQDDCDSMFFMDDEIPSDGSASSSSKEENKNLSQKSLLNMFKSLTDGNQGVADIYKRQREDRSGVSPISFPSTSSSDRGLESDSIRSAEVPVRESMVDSARRGPGPLNKDLFGIHLYLHMCLSKEFLSTYRYGKICIVKHIHVYLNVIIFYIRHNGQWYGNLSHFS